MEPITDSELLKVLPPILILAINSINKRTHIASYLDYLNDIVSYNKQNSGDGDNEKDGPITSSLDDLYLQVITKNFMSSSGDEFLKSRIQPKEEEDGDRGDDYGYGDGDGFGDNYGFGDDYGYGDGGDGGDGFGHEPFPTGATAPIRHEPPPLEYRGDAPYNMPSLHQPPSPPPPPAPGALSIYQPPPSEYRGDAPYNMPSLHRPPSPPPPPPRPPPRPPPPQQPQQQPPQKRIIQDAPCIKHPGRI